MTVLERHHLSKATFEDLASGRGGGKAVEALRSGVYSRRQLQLKLLVDAVSGAPARRLSEALDLLAEAQRYCGDAGREVLTHPQLGTWLGACTRGVREPAEIEQAVAVAAATAIRAGVDADLDVSIPPGGLNLPTLGMIVPPAGDTCRARIHVRRGEASITTPAGTVPVSAVTDAPQWRRLRRLTATASHHGLLLDFDDLDPYYPPRPDPLAGRQPTTAMARWQAKLQEAWEVLNTHARPRAGELSAGLLRSVTPLAATGTPRSVTLRDAPGNFAATPPDHPIDFAVTFVHEFQHTKLGALLDLVDLFRLGNSGRYYAPWRPDPRPLAGLFQGCYAFLAMADLWRTLRGTPVAPDADYQFARCREQVDEAVGTLVDCPDLTPAGQEFVAGMRAEADGMLSDEVSGPAAGRARAANANHRNQWRRQHGQE